MAERQQHFVAPAIAHGTEPSVDARRYAQDDWLRPPLTDERLSELANTMAVEACGWMHRIPYPLHDEPEWLPVHNYDNLDDWQAWFVAVWQREYRAEVVLRRGQSADYQRLSRDNRVVWRTRADGSARVGDALIVGGCELICVQVFAADFIENIGENDADDGAEREFVNVQWWQIAE